MQLALQNENISSCVNWYFEEDVDLSSTRTVVILVLLVTMMMSIVSVLKYYHRMTRFNTSHHVTPLLTLQ